jgi:hypothetical protein
VGTTAKDSSCEIGSIVLGRAELWNGDTGMLEVVSGDSTINPAWDQSDPVAVVEPGTV